MTLRGGKGAVRTAVDVLLGLAAADMLVLAAAGDFVLHLPFFQIRAYSMQKPFSAILALVAARFLITCAEERSLRTPLWRGIRRTIPAAIALTCAVAAVWRSVGYVVSSPAHFAIVCAAAAGAMVMCCASYWTKPGFGGAAKATIVMFLGGCVFLFSPHNLTQWGEFGSFGFSPWTSNEDAGGVTPAGLPEAQGLRHRTVTLTGDTRPALVLSNGDSFAMPAGEGERTFTFSLGDASDRTQERRRPAKFTLYLAKGASERRVLFEKTYDTSDLLLWRDEQCHVSAGERGLRIEALVEAGEATKVAVANPRFVTERADRPNIVLLVIDALRADHMSLYGYGRKTSPAIDSLAETGTVFRRARAVSSWTIPSISSVFTGLCPTVHGMTTSDRFLPGRVKTLAECLTEAGYYCGAIQPNRLVTASRGFARGFAEYHEMPLEEATTFDREIFIRAPVMNQYAIEWIKTHKTRPFFLYMHYEEVHAPYEPPREYAVFGQEPIDRYDGGVLSTTTEVARLIDFIRNGGLCDNSVVILTADHGEQFREHGKEGHGKGLNIEDVSIPMVIWGAPPTGVLLTGLVQNQDLFASILDLAKACCPQGVTSRSLWGGDVRPGMPLRDECFSEVVVRKENRAAIRAVETAGEKLTVNFMNGQTQYYDLTADPLEVRGADGKDSDAARRLRALIDDHAAKMNQERKKYVTNDNTLDLSEQEIRQIRALGYFN